MTENDTVANGAGDMLNMRVRLDGHPGRITGGWFNGPDDAGYDIAFDEGGARWVDMWGVRRGRMVAEHA